MTRDEQLAFCKKCTNRKMDLQQGLLCGLTGEKANFQDECPDYNLDETIKPPLNYTDQLDPGEIKTRLNTDAVEKLRMEQNLPVAIIAGVLAGLVGAALWAIISVTTGYQIGYLAIGIGAIVGVAMRFTGKGIDQIFGISGGIIAIFSCFIGNYFSIVGYFSNQQGVDFFEILSLIGYDGFLTIMQESFRFIDLVFYGIAAGAGYKFAFRAFTEGDLAKLK